MAEKNSTILDSVWLEGTNDYQQRIPQASQTNVRAVQEALFDPMNRQYWNQFVDGLINRIGKVVVHSRKWGNPLSIFKQGMLNYGSTIEEIGTKLVKAHGYDLEASDLFKVERPESKAAFHTVNRQDRYDLTVNMVELRKAFDSEYGLSDYINSIMDIPVTSDNYDEYRIMLQLIAEYEAQDNGFFKIQANPVTSQATAQDLLVSIRSTVGKMRFLSNLYNRAGIPVFANAEDLVLLTTPDVVANLDVRGLAAAFNVDYADVQTRIVLVDEFPITGAQALLVSKDWFVCADYVYENQSFYNPQTLNTNYYLHHWGIYSVSPFMPAVLFTDSVTTTPTITQAVTGLDFVITDVNGATVTTADKGDKYRLVTDLEGTLTADIGGVPTNLKVNPDSVTYDISVEDSSGNAVKRTGIRLVTNEVTPTIKVLKNSNAQTGDVITITVTATYADPSNSTTTEYTESQTLTIS